MLLLLSLVPLPEARAASDTATAAGGKIRITQTARWNREIPGGTAARVTIDVETDMDLTKAKDVVFVVDCSALQDLDTWIDNAVELAGYLRTVPGMRAALVSYESNSVTRLNFTTDFDALISQLRGLVKGRNSDAYTALQMAENLINRRADKSNPACIAYFGNGRFNLNYRAQGSKELWTAIH